MEHNREMTGLMMQFEKRLICDPRPGCEWAEKMVLNPALVRDPSNPDVIHMLFRATGPWREKQRPGCPLPYPIFAGYAVSRDRGEHWEFDFSRPALAPALAYEREAIRRINCAGEEVFDYANGCIEDPRIFPFEGKLYCSVACRVFPPGPYWIKDDPVQCMPQWALDPAHGLGNAVTGNTTVTLLFELDLEKLAAHDYDHAFRYVAPLHEPDTSDDRDAFLFPRRLEIGGKKWIACLHRPQKPGNYAEGRDVSGPSIFLSLAEEISDFSAGRSRHFVLAQPQFPWEADRIGASWAPLELSPGEWLLPYHGKQDARVGYTQSFLLLQERADDIPEVTARPAGRMLYADQPWELEGEFTTPCLFSCSGIVLDDGRLLMGYGAADTRIGLASCNFATLIAELRSCEERVTA